MKRLLRIAVLAVLVPCVGAAAASAQDLVPTLDCEVFDANTNTQIAELSTRARLRPPSTSTSGRTTSSVWGSCSVTSRPSSYRECKPNVFATSWVVSASQPQVTWFLNGDFVVAKGPVNSGSCAGDSANTILNGSGAPANTLGNDGDFYIDTAGHLLYGPKAGGHWPATGVSLVGPTGATGPQGPQGPPGMPVCRNTPATIILCDALFVPGTWTVGPKPMHATDTLTRGRTVYARGSGTVTRSGRLAPTHASPTEPRPLHPHRAGHRSRHPHDASPHRPAPLTREVGRDQ